MGIVAFEYNPVTAEIIRVVGRYSGFEDPGYPLSDEVREITGITDDMVAGQAFDDDQVNALAQQATLVIAHNAAFDRPFVEKRFPVFAELAWAMFPGAGQLAGGADFCPHAGVPALQVRRLVHQCPSGTGRRRGAPGAVAGAAAVRAAPRYSRRCLKGHLRRPRGYAPWERRSTRRIS